MHHRSTGLSGLGTAAAIAMLSACSQQGGDGLFQTGQIVGGGTKQMTDSQAAGGFLPQPSLLTAGGPGQPDLRYVNPAVDLSSYRKVMLDPVAIWTEPGSQLSSLPESQRLALTNSFYSDLYKAMAKRCRMVTTPSPGTMRMRIALIDAHSTNAAENTVATYTPYVSTAYSLGSLAFNHGVGYFAGTATAEGYAKDATTGTLIWQAVDKRGGTTSLAENTLNTWLDVDHAFQAWSEQIASRMQQLGACPS